MSGEGWWRHDKELQAKISQWELEELGLCSFHAKEIPTVLGAVFFQVCTVPTVNILWRSKWTPDLLGLFKLSPFRGQTGPPSHPGSTVTEAYLSWWSTFWVCSLWAVCSLKCVLKGIFIQFKFQMNIVGRRVYYILCNSFLSPDKSGYCSLVVPGLSH